MAIDKGKSEIIRKLIARQHELALTNVCEDQEMNALIQAHNPDTWKELQARASDVLNELFALNQKCVVPECLAQVMDNLDTALCDMDHELHQWLREVNDED